MANYTAKDIKELRERTGAGMLDVKKALDEADGDQGKAMEILRVKGLKRSVKREGNTAAEGLVVGRVSEKAGYLLELNSETDFVAKSEPFIALGEKIMDVVVENDLSETEAVLAAKLGDSTVGDQIAEASGTLGEKVVLRRIAKVEGENVELYLHRTSKDLPAQVGVLFAASGENLSEAAHDVAVHIAAMSPTFLSREDVPAETVENEKRVAEETAKAEGKPEKIIPKIVEGRMNGYYKENVLVDQDFAKDSKVSIGQFLSNNGGQATAFVRFRVGS